ncbi:family 3 glycoside hydrolase [Phakopsora pachyrhizi]|uniref:beta-glucosidase n=1 Tax=Phakopsora pachyrhizi TaxID=170000 RepID=A0AAV0ANS4_PHAPC|nr:family 3 glycoside hydrolase [Phakopsora pachyrhizi]
MTLEEKVKVVQGQGRCVGTTFSVNGAVKIPEFCLQDGPAGLRQVTNATAFPAGISVAATWNRELMRARGVAMGEEWRANGAHVVLGPAIDVTRAPEGGRSWESFGADPYLNGEAGYETIVGIQSQGVQACPKHLIGYQQEHFRFDMSVEIDERTLREVYLHPFKRAIEADATCVMCSYNKLNGTWACKNPKLTGSDGLLRSEYGFKGYVVSDWGATHGSLLSATGTIETVKAGIDLEMPGGFILAGGGVFKKLKASVENKSLEVEAVNQMVTRILSSWLKLGQDEISFNVNNKNSVNGVNARSQTHIELSRKIGAASVIMLKNSKKSLPLGKPNSLAIVGIDAGDIKKKNCDMNACDLKGTIPVGWGSGANSLSNVISPFQAIQNHLKVESPKTQIFSSLNQDSKKARKICSNSEVAIVFLYSFSGEIGVGLTSVMGNFGDRSNLKVFDKGDELVLEVASSNSNTIVVIHSVGSVMMELWVDHPNVTAILIAGLPGEQTGPAIADVLFGKVNPSGRLPYTISKSENDFGVNVTPYNPLKFGFTPTVTYNEGLLTDYKRFDAFNVEPRYPFGHGLSYTNFTYSDLKVASPTNDGNFRFTATIRNSGELEGTEIAQLYIGFPPGSGEPPKLLRGFDTVTIPPGSQKSVQFIVKQNDLR